LEASKASISKEEIRKLLDVEKLKYCFECGICTASCSMAELIKEDYNPRNLLEKIFLSPYQVLTSEELWLCAWCYNCFKHCPQALRIPEILNFFRVIAVEQGDVESFESALRKIVDVVPFPLTAMLVCFHPERAGLKTEKILEKINEMRHKTLKKGKKQKTKSDAAKVAVIGSGPAGLTVAYELVQKGFEVTVFEAFPEPGGMLRKCIPEYRLPKRILAEDIAYLQSLGVEIKTGVRIGEDLSFEDLQRNGYKVIFVGVGADKSQKLKIEGGDLNGVVHALDFLWHANSGEKAEVGKNVVVIGGGNVAVDAAKTALKMGAEKVTIFYRRSKGEMPANPWEIKEAEEEGVRIEFIVAPKRVLGEDGKVSAVEFVRMQLGELDESGRRKPTAIDGSEFIWKTDMVILATGETPNLEFLPKEIELNDDGTVWVNPITMETTLSSVFAGGDVTTGPASVIEAICAGKRAAESIENYLKSLGSA